MKNKTLTTQKPAPRRSSIASKIRAWKRHGQTQIVRYALIVGLAVTGIPVSLGGEIHLAAQKGDLERVKALLKAHPDWVSAKDDRPDGPFTNDRLDSIFKTASNYTPLHWAAKEGHKEVAEYLLADGADANAKTAGGETALHLAAGGGYAAVVELLLPRTSDVNARNKAGETALHWAAIAGQPSVVKSLLAGNADCSLRDNGGNTPLHLAAKWSSGNVVELLLFKAIASHLDVNARNNEGCTPLHLAAKWGHKDVAELLLDSALAQQAEVNARDNLGNTPLHLAAKWDHKNIAELLLANRADIGAMNKLGHTALDLAEGKTATETHSTSIEMRNFKTISIAENRNSDIVEFLRQRSAAANDPANTIEKFQHALLNDDLETARTLLSSNPDLVSSVSKFGYTPLHTAAAKGLKEMVKLLLANKAEVNAKDKYGETPLHLAAGSSHLDVVEILRQHGGHD